MIKRRVSSCRKASPWRNMLRGSLKRIRKLSFLKPRSIFSRRVLVRSLPTLKKNVSSLSFKTSKLSGSKTRSLRICTSQSAKRTKKVQIWSQSARWYWTRDLTLNSSFWSLWSKSRRRSAVRSKRRWLQSKATLSLSSCPWSNLAANSQRRTTNRSRTPNSNRRFQWSWTTSTGPIVRPCFASCSPKWTREMQLAAGAMLLLKTSLRKAGVLRLPKMAMEMEPIKTWTEVLETMSMVTINSSSHRTNSSTTIKNITIRKPQSKVILVQVTVNEWVLTISKNLLPVPFNLL